MKAKPANQEIELNLTDWQNAKNVAEASIKNALIQIEMYTPILEKALCQIKIMSKESEKKEKSSTLPAGVG